MKKRNICKSLLFSGLLLLSAGLWSCSDDKVEEDPGTQNSIETATIEVATANVYATSVDLSLTVAGVDSYAYEYVEGETTAERRAELIYSNAQKEGGNGIHNLTDGTHTLSVYGLEGSKTYTVYIAFKAGEGFAVKRQVVTTSTYTELLTLIYATKNSIKFHIQTGGDTFRYCLGLAETMYSMTDQFGQTPIDFLNSGFVATKDTTVTINNGDMIDPDDPSATGYSITPGTAWKLWIAQADSTDNGWGQKGLYVEGDVKMGAGTGGDAGNGGGMGPLGSRTSKPDFENYKEYSGQDGDRWVNEYKNENFSITTTMKGRAATMDFWTEAFDEHENTMTVNQLKLNQRTVTYSFVPGEGVVKYGATIFNETDYNKMMSWVGEKGLVACVINSQTMNISNEAQELTLQGLEKGVKYYLFVIAAYNDAWTEISSQIIPFERIETDKKTPAALIIEPEENKDPHQVSFRVKKGDDAHVAILRYVMESGSEWNSLLNPDQGVTEETILAQYGKDINEPQVIEELNSSEGTVVTFPNVEENTAFKLVAVGLNEDEAQGAWSKGISRSAEEWGTNKLESEFFTDVLGMWEVTYPYKAWQSDKDVTIGQFYVDIVSKPDETGVTSWQEYKSKDPEAYETAVNALMQAYPEQYPTMDKANEALDEQIKEFNGMVDHFGEKYRSLNRVMIRGFEPLHEYKSAWDLFSYDNYTSYDLQELFYDYGPKMFLQYGQDANKQDSIVLAADPTKYTGVTPIAAWKNYTYYMFAYAPKENTFTGVYGFQVDWKKDKSDEGADTLVIKGFGVLSEDEQSIVAFNPSVGYWNTLNDGSAKFKTYGEGAITMVKRSDRPAPLPNRYYATGRSASARINPYRGNGRFMKPFVPSKINVLKKGVLEPVSFDEVIKAKAKAGRR